MRKNIDINEVAVSLEVDSDAIEAVRKGDIRCIRLEINEHNQNLILENMDGNLILITDEMPNTFHGCYLYNNGVFPYAIKDSLKFIVLSAGEDYCLTRIIDKNTEPGTRFNYQGAGKPIVEAPNGDCCVWEVLFDVVSILPDARTYLMRWNPSVSSFTEKNYEECVANMKGDVFFMDWSIREWEQARRGDYFYMMRVGDDKAGIVFNGQFLSDPYVGEDWGGSTKRRLYVDMVCQNTAEPEEVPFISLAKLKEAIPKYDWEKGHSGELLPKDVAEALSDLWAGE